MYCSYHPSNAARVRCTNCSRILCPYCDHRIKGYPYCQDCIVMGIESLTRVRISSGRSKNRSRLAALCALVPGGGAVFNRQNFKAFVFFVAVAGLFQLTRIHALAGLFGLAGIAVYLYTIVDSYRTAELIARGESPAHNEQGFKRWLARRAAAVGLMLISSGLLLLIQVVRPFDIGVSILRFLPVALIILGGYLIVAYLKRSREEDYSIHSSSRPKQSLIQSRDENEASHLFGGHRYGAGGRSGELR